MSKLARHLSRNVPMAKARACRTCGSPWHSLCRAAPLERGGRVNPRREEPRRSSRTEDPAYLQWCREQPCYVGQILGHFRDCSPVVDPEHERQGVGMSQTASDRRAWPCCRLHHKERHALNGNGFFAGYTKPELRTFIERRIEEANVAYEQRRRLNYTAPAR